MTRDFTVEMYGELLDAALTAGYDPLTVRAALRRGDLPERCLILRHDVDRKPANALRMARLEADRGIAATYYLRTSTFDTAIADTLASLGHEVGYHYEDLARVDGDLSRAHERFARNLSTFRATTSVDTVCVYDNPFSSHDNREMWRAPETPGFEAYDLLGEASLSMDFDAVDYFSDTGRTWRDDPRRSGARPASGGSEAVTADGTADLIDLLSAGRVPRVYAVAHPSRWADSYSELLVARTTDGAVNAVKYGLHCLS